MRYVPVMLCVAALLVIPVQGKCGLFSRNKAKLSEPAMTDRIDQKTQAPIEIKDRFSPDTGTIYATIKLSDAPKNTEIKALFYMLGDSERQIAEDSFVTNGTGYVSFSLDGPPSGWPLSRYKVAFLLNGKVREELFFTVASDSTPAQKASTQQSSTPAPATKPGYKTFKDIQIGVSFELPDGWQFYVEAGSGNYIFNGPPGTDESEVTIVVQILDSRKGGKNDLKLEMLNMIDQIEALEQSEIVKKDQIEISGVVAPFFLATYPAKNQAKQTVEFGHTQLGLDNEPYLLLISYAAPREIYQNKVDIFQHMMDSARLFEPEG